MKGAKRSTFNGRAGWFGMVTACVMVAVFAADIMIDLQSRSYWLFKAACSKIGAFTEKYQFGSVK